MKLANSVASQLTPWYMSAQRAEAILPTLDEDIRPHAANIVRNGFTVIKGSIPKARCAELIEKFKAFADANPEKFRPFLDADGHYPRIINLHAAMPDLFDLFSTNRLAYRVQEAMFGAEPALYTSLFYERGSAQPVHRDTPVFCTKPDFFYFGVWVALEDAGKANGALQAYRGGHLLPEQDLEAMALRHYDSLEGMPPYTLELWQAYQDAVTKQCEEASLPLETIHAEAGDTVIWHPHLPHGGGPIEDLTKSRFSLVMHTTPIGVPVYHQNVFFNPAGNASTDAHWEYERIDGHWRVKHWQVDFAHKQAYDVDSFRLPGA